MAENKFLLKVSEKVFLFKNKFVNDKEKYGKKVKIVLPISSYLLKIF